MVGVVVVCNHKHRMVWVVDAHHLHCPLQGVEVDVCRHLNCRYPVVNVSVDRHLLLFHFHYEEEVCIYLHLDRSDVHHVFGLVVVRILHYQHRMVGVIDVHHFHCRRHGVEWRSS